MQQGPSNTGRTHSVGSITPGPHAASRCISRSTSFCSYESFFNLQTIYGGREGTLVVVFQAISCNAKSSPHQPGGVQAIQTSELAGYRSHRETEPILHPLQLSDVKHLLRSKGASAILRSIYTSDHRESKPSPAPKPMTYWISCSWGGQAGF